MKRYSTSELRHLEIVNSCDGTKLGCASDFEFEADGDCTKVTALIIRGGGGFLGFGCSDDLRIPWCDVQCIGEDIILVKLSSQEWNCFCNRRHRFGRK
ncbi:MAG: YlmC/YmxH family sporulation protein [Clostridia bacterium]|nr:YlmC/YmxH family sporulation protein [Clostridia bacterium]